MEDGPVLNFSVVPKRTTDAIAIAVVDDSSKVSLIEALLLRVTFHNGKAEVDLNVPYGGTHKAFGQMVKVDKYCHLRVIQNGQIRLSVPWSTTEKLAIQPDEESFSDLCTVLVEADMDEPTTLEPIQN